MKKNNNENAEYFSKLNSYEHNSLIALLKATNRHDLINKFKGEQKQ